MPEEERHRTQQALSEDRERIAADLHDKVIQKIFAAGLQLQGLVPDLPEETRKNVAEIMTELDGAIIALRGAIFALTQPVMPVDTEQSLRDLATRAQRVLGFTPAVELRGTVEVIDRGLHDELLAVALEALSNVAKHAGATAVQVVLTVEEGRATLEVADDGAGMPTELPHASGTGNIARRAEERGGTASWLPGEPQGTRLVWSVPVASR